MTEEESYKVLDKLPKQFKDLPKNVKDNFKGSVLSRPEDFYKMLVYSDFKHVKYDHTVHLDFLKTGLSGFDYGLSTYNLQIEPYLRYGNYKPGDTINFIISSNVAIMSSSFVAGLFSELVKLVGVDGFKNKFSISHPDTWLVNSIKEDLVYSL